MLHERADHQPASLARGAFGAAGVVPGAATGVDVAGAGLAGVVGGAVMRDTILCLYDLTGNIAKPWIEAGYKAVIVDMQHKGGVSDDGVLMRVGADIRSGWMPPRELIDRVAFVAAFPPCDHLAVSGSRWFKGKGLRKLALSIDLFATAAELCEWIGAPYIIENPVSTISTYWRKPDAVFHLFTRQQ